MENQTEISQSTVSSEQSTVSTTTPSTVHRSPNSFLVILLSILLLISLVIAGLFAFKTQQLVNELRVTRDELRQIPTSDPTDNLSRAESRDWKTYTGSTFTFLYPNELQLENIDGKIIVRIDPPNLKTVEGICPKYVSFSISSSNSLPKNIEDKYSCVYESKLVNQNIFIESQYPRSDSDLNNQILSTFKFLDEGTAKISIEELSKGWYWGMIDQKKTNTPSDWVFKEAGRSSCWHKVGKLCQ